MRNQISATSLGDYIPIKTIGVGATGKVKLARHVRTGQYVALKIIRKRLLDTKRDLFQKVRREIAVMKLVAGNCHQIDRLKRINSPLLPPNAESYIGVMNLIDVYDTEQSFVLVLEYCEGGELFDVLVEHGHLPQAQVLDYFQQLVYALEFCHNRGVCHRDLKLENVLLTADGRLKLADFGMASLLTPGSLLETSCGSPQYCAPEVVLGEAYAGKTADVWSLGVVLFAMTTGGLPFDDDNIQRLMNKIQAGAFYMPAEVPDDLAQLIRSMLVVDTSKRATLADIKSSEWFQSHPCRKNIYRDENFNLREALSPAAQMPVTEPDVTILRYLADLGLGDCPTIRRRLASYTPCLERDFYFQLAEFCGDSLDFVPATEKGVVLSPKRSMQLLVEPNVKSCMPKTDVYGNNHVHTSEGMGLETDVIKGTPTEPHGSHPMTVSPWLPQLALALASETTHGPVPSPKSQFQQSAPAFSSVSSR